MKIIKYTQPQFGHRKNLNNTHNHNSTYATIMPPPCFSFYFVLCTYAPCSIFICTHMLALFLLLWNVPSFPQLYPTTSWPFTLFNISTALFSLHYCSPISSLGIKKYCLALVIVSLEAIIVTYFTYLVYTSNQSGFTPPLPSPNIKISSLGIKKYCLALVTVL